MDSTQTEPPAAAITLKHILLGTDFSLATPVALSHAAAIARRYGSEICVAHVIASQADPLLLPEEVAGKFEETTARAEKELANLAKELGEIPHETVLAQGEVTEALSEIAGKHDIDLIVIGTHGRRGLKRFVLGSVAEEILRNSPCPVLTVGPHVARAPEMETFRRIIYPTDLSAESHCAAPYVGSLAGEDSALVTVLHVLPRVTATFSGVNVLSKAFRGEMKKLLPVEATRRCHPEFDVELGNPVETILRIAKEGQAGLIVFGVRRAKGLTSHFEGNIVDRVAASAECPVLTVLDSGDTP